MIWWRTVEAADERHHDTSNAAVQTRGLDLDDEQDVLITSRILVDAELRHVGL